MTRKPATRRLPAAVARTYSRHTMHIVSTCTQSTGTTGMWLHNPLSLSTSPCPFSPPPSSLPPLYTKRVCSCTPVAIIAFAFHMPPSWALDAPATVPAISGACSHALQQMNQMLMRLASQQVAGLHACLICLWFIWSANIEREQQRTVDAEL